MNRRPAAGVVALLLAVGACGPAAVDAEVTQEATAAPAPPPGVPRKGKPPPDPDAGLTDEEKYAKHSKGFHDFQERLMAWVETPEVQALDPRELPKSGLLVSKVEGYKSLLEATNRADLAVLGTVERTRFWRYFTLARVRVERTAKGHAPDVVTVVLGSGVRPGVGSLGDPARRTEGAVLAVDDSEPQLFPGDRAILLLNEEAVEPGIGTVYNIRPWSGGFGVRDGRVTANQWCEFAADVSGDDAGDVMDRIEAYAGTS